MVQLLPYCGAPPIPGGLESRINDDPVLVCVLLVLGIGHYWVVRREPSRWFAACGWLIAAAALISPLCALSVSLFSARVGQHMVLILAAAPLVALASGRPWLRPSRHSPWLSATAFLVFLWIWHMPVPYDATFKSTAVYWSMHITLFGSAVCVWRALLHPASDRAFGALAAGAFTFVQMGLLGAVLAFANRPLFLPHSTTTFAWGLSPLEDQQLGGIFMWVPGIALFLWVAVRSVGMAMASTKHRIA